MREQPRYAELVTACYLDEDNLAAAKRFAASEEFEAVARLLRLKSARSLDVLDLGCGNGIASYAFAALGHRVTAIDPDPSADVGLAAAARLSAHVPGRISTRPASAESLPFADASFDVVYERQALHHFRDLRRGLAECARVLRPGGRLLATREHVVNDESQLEAFLAAHPLQALHGGEHAYPLEEYLSALAAAGLKVVRCLAPYDSVVNHFPESNQQVRAKIYDSLRRRVGRAASLLLRIRYAEDRYRRRLSAYCDEPGRLYSFLCVKEK
ncbi:MAG: methyltransferase domain-containing protein [Acidobacteriota bacterium]|nr:methyltransferase domain-containing protein [Acidobacteriota bacterium]